MDRSTPLAPSIQHQQCFHFERIRRKYLCEESVNRVVVPHPRPANPSPRRTSYVCAITSAIVWVLLKARTQRKGEHQWNAKQIWVPRRVRCTSKKQGEKSEKSRAKVNGSCCFSDLYFLIPIKWKKRIETCVVLKRCWVPERAVLPRVGLRAAPVYRFTQHQVIYTKCASVLLVRITISKLSTVKWASGKAYRPTPPQQPVGLWASPAGSGENCRRSGPSSRRTRSDRRKKRQTVVLRLLYFRTGCQR